MIPGQVPHTVLCMWVEGVATALALDMMSWRTPEKEPNRVQVQDSGERREARSLSVVGLLDSQLQEAGKEEKPTCLFQDDQLSQFPKVGSRNARPSCPWKGAWG